mmetsp:Transcript_74993/g.219678  ORF Transcript_74993/g.219678 Transcript_74993/m.219678 type:complete len:215 (+) Transcript_74993:556-1200(+)
MPGAILLLHLSDAAVLHAVGGVVLLQVLPWTEGLGQEVVRGSVAHDQHGAAVGGGQRCLDRLPMPLRGLPPTLCVAFPHAPDNIRVGGLHRALVLPVEEPGPWKSLALLAEARQGVLVVQPLVRQQFAEAFLYADGDLQGLRHGSRCLQSAQEGGAEESRDGRDPELRRLPPQVLRDLLRLHESQNVQRRVCLRVRPRAVPQHEDAPLPQGPAA